MFLRVVSDLHIEFGVPYTLPEPTPQDEQTVFVFAGDLTSGANTEEFIRGIVARSNYRAYIFIPGNHEFYGNDFEKLTSEYDHLSKQLWYDFNNVYFTSTFDSIQIDDTTFLFGPMWTDGGPSPKMRSACEGSLNDFKVIKYGNRTFTVDDMEIEFSNFVYSLTDALDELQTNRVVLVTHHLPSFQAIDPKFVGSLINGGFAVNLDYYVNPEYLERIDVMCFGHTHSKMLDTITVEDGTKPIQCICNPRGYPNEFRTSFDPDLLFDLDSMTFVKKEYTFPE